MPKVAKKAQGRKAQEKGQPQGRTSITIWHNPKCGTSRKVLDLIRAKGIEPTIVDYVKAPPSVADIKAVLDEMGARPRDLLRRRGTPYDALGLDDGKLTDTALIAAMHAHPILIERPVVRAVKGTRLCRPPERLKEIL
jgi:arsenate reductase (glutaredoxin)